MGTNYYLITRNKEFIEKHFPFEYELTDHPDFGYRVHLNKCSLGWRTLFQNHDKAYKSVRELYQFLNDHKDDLEIYNEYDEPFDIEEYRTKVLMRDNKLLEKKEPFCWKKDKIFGGDSLQLCEEGEKPEIWSPFDHMEYERVENEHYRCRTIFKAKYSCDPEGYNFLEGEFS